MHNKIDNAVRYVGNTSRNLAERGRGGELIPRTSNSYNVNVFTTTPPQQPTANVTTTNSKLQRHRDLIAEYVRDILCTDAWVKSINIEIAKVTPEPVCQPLLSTS